VETLGSKDAEKKGRAVKDQEFPAEKKLKGKAGAKLERWGKAGSWKWHFSPKREERGKLCVRGKTERGTCNGREWAKFGEKKYCRKTSVTK